MKHILALQFSLFMSAVLFAQQGESTLFTFGSADVDELVQVLATPDDEFLAFGTTSGMGLGADFWLSKYSNSMTCLWTNVYSPTFTNQVERGMDIVPDGQGNYYLIGYGNTGSDNGYDALVYKVDSESNPLWFQYYGGSDWDFGIAGAMVNGQLAIVGETYTDTEGGKDGIVWLIDGNGNLVTQWTWGSEDEEGFVDAQVNNSGYLVVAGNRTNETTQQETAHLMAYSLDGDVQWSITKDGDQIQHNAISLNFDEGIMSLVGRKKESVYSPWLLEVQEDGSFQQIDFATFSGDYYYTSILRTEEMFYAIGNTSAFGGGGVDGVLYQFSSSYNYYSGNTFGDQEDDFMWDIAMASNGALVCVGQYQSLPNALAQGMVVYVPELDTDGYTNTNNFDGFCFVSNIDEGMRPIDYTLPVHAHVFSSTGQLVMNYAGMWNPSLMHSWNLPSGIYVATIQQGEVLSRVRFFQP